VNRTDPGGDLRKHWYTRTGFSGSRLRYTSAGTRAATALSSRIVRRPSYHRTRDSIEAHLTIVLAALAVSRLIEH